MNEAQNPDSETVVDECVNHYKAEKLANGAVRLSSGGRVVVRPTYYEALEALAQWGQEQVEDSPEHLREDKRESIAHDCINPELDDVVANDAERIKESVVDDVADGETTISRSGAWLAERQAGEIADDVLGDRIDVYRLWDTQWSNEVGDDE